MKKAIALLFFVFFLNSVSGQDLRSHFQEAAKKDLATLKTIVFVPESQNEQLYNFFYKKYKLYSIANNEPKKLVNIKVELENELKSFFNSVENKKLDRNRKILAKLVSE